MCSVPEIYQLVQSNVTLGILDLFSRVSNLLIQSLSFLEVFVDQSCNIVLIYQLY